MLNSHRGQIYCLLVNVSLIVTHAYLTGDGVDNHAIEVRSKLHPFAQKNLDEYVLLLFENTLVLDPH